MYKLRTVKSIDLLEAFKISKKFYVRDIIFTKYSGAYLIWTLQDLLVHPIGFKFFTAFEKDYWNSKGNLEIKPSYNGKSFRFKNYLWFTLGPSGFQVPGIHYGSWNTSEMKEVLEKFGINYE